MWRFSVTLFHMAWAGRRRFTYLSFAFLIIALVLAVLYLLFFYRGPTCFDGIQNGSERGIDCGGGCKRICAPDAKVPIVLWSRSFAVVPGVYNALAYIENPNTQFISSPLSYRFKLFDEKNILVAEREGSTILTATGIVPVFEGGIITGERTPLYTFFEFTADVSWQLRDTDKHIIVVSKELHSEDLGPRIEAVLQNPDVTPLHDIEAVATVFDEHDNAINASRTIVELLPAGGKTTIVFTWPEPFSAKPVRIDVIARTLND